MKQNLSYFRNLEALEESDLSNTVSTNTNLESIQENTNCEEPLNEESCTITLEANNTTLGPFEGPKTVTLDIVYITDTCKEFWYPTKNQEHHRYPEILDTAIDFENKTIAKFSEREENIRKIVSSEAFDDIKNRVEKVSTALKIIKNICNQDHSARVVFETSSGDIGPFDCKVRTALLLGRIKKCIHSVDKLKHIPESQTLNLTEIKSLQKEFRELQTEYFRSHADLLPVNINSEASGQIYIRNVQLLGFVTKAQNQNK